MNANEQPFCDLKTVRKNRNMTQQKLADLLNIRSASVAMIENNKRGASLGLVIQMMDVLECGFRDLYPAGKIVHRPAEELGPGATQLLIV